MNSVSIPRLLTTAMVLVISFATHGEEEVSSRFIIDKLYVSLREGPDENSVVVAGNLPSGTQLTLITEDKTNGYSQVTTAGGTQGWLKTRYLQKTPTAALKISSLEKQLSDAVSKDKGALQKELQAAEDNLKDANSRITKMEKELTEIKYASTNVVKISAQNKELTEKNQLLQSKIDSLGAVSQQKNSDESMTFFVYGGLLVLATLILNMLIDSIKRKRSYGSGGW